MPLPDIVTANATTLAARQRSQRQRKKALRETDPHDLTQHLLKRGFLCEAGHWFEVGFAPYTRRIDIRRFSLSPLMQGSGLEDQIVEAMQEYAQTEGWELMVLTLLPKEEPFWAEHGFRPNTDTVFNDWYWKPSLCEKLLLH